MSADILDTVDGIYAELDEFERPPGVEIHTFNDISRQTLTRISFDEDTHDPLWHPSGEAVVYAGGLEPTRELHRIAADGTGSPELVTGGDVSLRAASWSGDGRLLALGV